MLPKTIHYLSLIKNGNYTIYCDIQANRSPSVSPVITNYLLQSYISCRSSMDNHNNNIYIDHDIFDFQTSYSLMHVIIEFSWTPGHNSIHPGCNGKTAPWSYITPLYTRVLIQGLVLYIIIYNYKILCMNYISNLYVLQSKFIYHGIKPTDILQLIHNNIKHTDILQLIHNNIKPTDILQLIHNNIKPTDILQLIHNNIKTYRFTPINA